MSPDISQCIVASKDLGVTLDHHVFESLTHEKDSSDLRVIGHDRAKKALEFGLSMAIPGFNIFCAGDAGSGRRTLSQQMLKEFAAQQPCGNEWCYINNFENQHAPDILYLDPGSGKKLISLINHFIDNILTLFPESFENPHYQRQKKVIERKFTSQYERAITEVEQEALNNSVGLYEEEGSITFAPLVDGKAIDDAQFSALDEAQRNNFYTLLSHLEEKLSEKLLELPVWKRESSEQLRKLEYETIDHAVKPLLKDLGREYSSNLGVQKYLKIVKHNIAEAIVDILNIDDGESEGLDNRKARQEFVNLFLPNLLIERDISEGAPVIYEQHPSYQNLFGTIDFSTTPGAQHTNHTMIRPGAFHKANGGFLMLDAEKLIERPHVWAQLKLALKTHEIKIEPPMSDSISGSSYPLQPEKIPLKVKVVLLGSREIYYALQAYDQEFSELFRVLADFDQTLTDSPKTLQAFSALVKERGHRLNYPSINNDAIAALATDAMRRSEHKNKLSNNIQKINEVLDEAYFIWGQTESNDCINASHIESAISSKQYRASRTSELMLNDIHEKQILIGTDGFEVGKVNGLTVFSVGDDSFGTPARITATAYAGKQGVTDIEREVDLGRAIHSKGVMLLTGFLGHKYGRSFHMSLSANIAIEQSYGLIDGDSASLAEICSLISAITELPIDQSIAVTGSISQHGEVQSVGGVNDKIEGFFKLCSSRGLTGKQGVIIPRTNQINLMLQQEIIDAVFNEQFYIYAVGSIDQALEILMHRKAGVKSKTGNYTNGSIHKIATEKLKELSTMTNKYSE